MDKMKESLRLETHRLMKSWTRHDSGTLRDYLVRDVEDPRINIQSILTRHFLIKEQFDEQYDKLMEHELRFALVVNWLLGLLKNRSELANFIPYLMHFWREKKKQRD